MFLTLGSKEKLIVDPSKIGEMHLKATCNVDVLRLRSLLLKLPTASVPFTPRVPSLVVVRTLCVTNK